MILPGGRMAEACLERTNAGFPRLWKGWKGFGDVAAHVRAQAGARAHIPINYSNPSVLIY